MSIRANRPNGVIAEVIYLDGPHTCTFYAHELSIGPWLAARGWDEDVSAMDSWPIQRAVTWPSHRIVEIRHRESGYADMPTVGDEPDHGRAPHEYEHWR